MTAFAEDPDTLRAEELARSYSRAYLETDSTFDEIVGRLDLDRCPDPDDHLRQFSSSETVWRRRAAGQLEQRNPGRCPWCGKTTYEPGGAL